jgi:hypothetical protein
VSVKLPRSRRSLIFFVLTLKKRALEQRSIRSRGPTTRVREGMENSFTYPEDDYALAILTHAAMQTNHNHAHTSHTSTSISTPNSGYDRSTAPSSTLTGADVRGSSAASMISNHSSGQLDINRNQDPSLAQTRVQDILSYTSVVPSSRSMETLTFNPAHAGGQHSYMGPNYQGIGSQISQNYAQTLGILNAESYDDGRAQQRSREMRLKQTTAPDPLMQFGMIEAPIRSDLERTDSDDLEKGSRRRKKHKIDHQNEDDDEEARKKARGRPRVDTKDETAADVSSIYFLIYHTYFQPIYCIWCRSWTLGKLELFEKAISISNILSRASTYCEC